MIDPDHNCVWSHVCEVCYLVTLYLVQGTIPLYDPRAKSFSYHDVDCAVDDRKQRLINIRCTHSHGLHNHLFQWSGLCRTRTVTEHFLSELAG